MNGKGIFPLDMTGDERQAVASAILREWYDITAGKAGASITATYNGMTITGRSKALDVLKYRIAQYSAFPSMFVLFVNRNRNDGGVFDKLWTHLQDAFPDELHKMTA